MLSQTGSLPVLLKKWNLKPPAGVFRLPNFESPPLSPKGAKCGEEADANGSGQSPRVPRGCLAVYVGEEMRRFVIPLSYLNQSIFRALLKKAEEEFGFSSNGGIRLPCQPLFFEHILWLLENKDPIVQNLQLEEILELYHEVGEECKSSRLFSCFPFQEIGT